MPVDRRAIHRLRFPRAAFSGEGSAGASPGVVLGPLLPAGTTLGVEWLGALGSSSLSD